MQFEQRGSQTARKWSNLIFIKLISAKGSHTGFDATGAQSDEEEAHHGQRAGRERKRADEQNAVAENGEKTKKKRKQFLTQAYTWKVMLSGFPSPLVSVMSAMALTAMATWPSA